MKYMERFGICVISTTADMEPTVQSLREALAVWNVSGMPGACELELQLVWGTPAVAYNAIGSLAVRRAARLISQVAKWRAAPELSGIEGSVIEVRINRESPPSGELLARMAWGLFLWTAVRHADNPIWEVLYSPKTPEPVSPQKVYPVPIKPVPIVAQSATAVQPLSRPKHPQSSGIAPAMSQGPPSAPRRRG